MNTMKPTNEVSPGLVLIVLAILVNILGHRTQRWNTICVSGRRIFRTDTPAGRVAFVVFWGALSRWFIPHFIHGDLKRTPKP